MTQPQTDALTPSSKTDNSLLTKNFQEALRCADEWHRGQVRKGTTIPYLSHLLGVTSLALEFGADGDEAIGALLHDALEDGPENTKLSPDVVLAKITQRFGEGVAGLVKAATDATPEPGQPKPAWAERKLEYLRHLLDASPSGLLVSASDKLYNARSILVDLLTGPEDEDVFSRFKPGREGTLQYYRLLADQYQRAAQRPEVAARPRLLALFSELERTVAMLEAATHSSADDVRAYPLLSALHA